MEDWDIPEQDDFESRYADELEMLDDLEEEGKYLLDSFYHDSFMIMSSEHFRNFKRFTAKPGPKPSREI